MSDERASEEQVLDTIGAEGGAADGSGDGVAAADAPSAFAADEFEPLLDFLRRTRNFDLSGYKRAGLLRRLTKRMRMVNVPDVRSYVAHLETHPEEFAQLLDTLLINVTAFFRDDMPWDYLGAEVLPRLVERRGASEPIRVWSAGCATGQEAYTLAMVLAEHLGAEAFRERVKIYATDLDDGALQRARHGIYSDSELADVPEALRDRYFEAHDQRWAFRRDFRRQVIFGRNDLLQDAPISRIDLLACRNTLMYFDSVTQAKILARFHFALNDDGVLLLGRAETLLTNNMHFAPLDLRRRVFVKVPRSLDRDRQFIVPRLLAPTGSVADEGSTRSLRQLALDAATVAQFAVDRDGRLAMANARARALFGLSGTDVGRPLQDLKVSYLPVELRSVIDQAYAEMRTVTRTDVAWRSPSGEPRWFDIVVAPLLRGTGQPDGASVSFVDTTRTRLLQQQIEESQAELEAAYQELQSTNEELETTNEELHSTVEELETTNEELQSTNEELETMNEELQSTNEELQTINDEHRLRGDEFNRVNGFLEAVLTSLRFGVVVLDRELRVLVWNHRAEDLWGLRMDEVEHMHFLNLDIGLPVARLVEPLRASLAGTEAAWEGVLPSTNRRGRPIGCRVTVMPLVRKGDEHAWGAIVLMHEQPGGAGPGEAAEG